MGLASLPAADGVLPTPVLDSDELELALAIISVTSKLRAEGRFHLQQWLQAAGAGMGGTLILQAPSETRKRSVPEVKYLSEGVKLTAIEN